MTEDEIRLAVKNKQYVDWLYISFSQKLSEEFVREFSDKVNWNYISFYQKLSIKFIKEFSNRVNWRCIPAHKFKIKHERSWRTFS